MVALGQQGHVIDQLVGAVVLGRNATGARLQAHVDVFGDQHHVQVGAPGPYFEQLVDDDVVVEVFRQQLVRLVARGHQDGQEALGPALATLDWHALFNVSWRGIAQGLVDQADGLATFSGDGVLSGLEFVELLQHRHRYGDVVLLEIEQCIWIVDQYIGIEHIKDWLVGGSGASLIIHTRSPLWKPYNAIPERCCAVKWPPVLPWSASLRVGSCPHRKWCPMTPPVMQGSAVCLLDTAKPMTGKSIFTYF
ncbi:hypothetical protein D9M71_350370 [compost metagenome]